MARDPLALLVVGFVLSTVAGGLITFGFQRRAWEHQHDVERQETLRAQAQQTFEEMSTLLDQRLYRMRLVFAAARRLAPANKGNDVRLAEALAEYRVVLRIWNDNLNRNLARVDTYFGEAARQRLEYVLFEDFRAIGEELDQFLREVGVREREEVPVRRLAPRLNGLSDDVYEFNLHLLRALRDDELSTAAPPAADRPFHRIRSVIGFGDHGEDVRALQRALVANGAAGLMVDGHFGLETERALTKAQAVLALEELGVAGPETQSALQGPTLDLRESQQPGTP